MSRHQTARVYRKINVNEMSSAEAYAYRNGPRSGTVFIFDLKGVSFWHLFQPSVSSVRKGIRFMEDGSPFDIKAIHVLNTVPFFDMIVGESIVKKANV